MTEPLPPLPIPRVPAAEFPTAGTHHRTAAERVLCLIAGGSLAVVGLRRGGAAGLVTAGLGAALAARGATGAPTGFSLPGFGLRTDDESRRDGVAPVHRGIRVEQTVTINRPAAELYASWRRFESLPGFMSHLESVVELDATRSHWVAKGPAGSKVEWDAEIFREVDGELIAWRSLPEAEVPNVGSVAFRELGPGRGTEVRVELQYDPPAGMLGKWIAQLFGENPNRQVREDLRRFKQMAEAGEIPTGASTAQQDNR